MFNSANTKLLTAVTLALTQHVTLAQDEVTDCYGYGDLLGYPSFPDGYLRDDLERVKANKVGQGEYFVDEIKF